MPCFPLLFCKLITLLIPQAFYPEYHQSSVIFDPFFLSLFLLYLTIIDYVILYIQCASVRHAILFKFVIMMCKCIQFDYFVPLVHSIRLSISFFFIPPTSSSSRKSYILDITSVNFIDLTIDIVQIFRLENLKIISVDLSQKVFPGCYNFVEHYTYRKQWSVLWCG